MPSNIIITIISKTAIAQQYRRSTNLIDFRRIRFKKKIKWEIKSLKILHTHPYSEFWHKMILKLTFLKLWYPKSMRCSFRPRVIITVMIQVTGTAQIFSSKLICPACVRCPLPGGGDKRIKTSLKQSDYPNLLSGATPGHRQPPVMRQ